MSSVFYLSVAIPVVLLQFLNLWLLSKGRLSVAYPIGIAVYLGYFGIETVLAISEPEQWPILIFNLVNVWGVAMNIRGLIRIRSQRTSVL